jgi:hypothetical protein
MKSISLWTLILVVGAGSTAIMKTRINEDVTDVASVQNSVQNADGAYRDGLYLGKLTASLGDEPHLCTGRWSRKTDQDLFSAGYERGYAYQIAKEGRPRKLRSL